MAESKFRRGVAVNSTGPQVAPHHTSKPIGRIHKSIGRQPAPPVGDPYAEERPSSLVDSTGTPFAARRQGLVTPGGEPIRRGLAKGTLEARDQVNNAQEECGRCGKERPSATFKVLVQSSDNGNQVRVCAPCASQAYKDPYPNRDGSFTNKDSWRLQKQDVRFSQGTAEEGGGRPFDASRMGASELLNGDSFHRPDFNADVAPTLGAQQHGRVGKIRS